MQATVELREIRKSFGTTEIVRGVSLTIRPGEFVVLVGPSGCGKSTLLRMIAGLEDISSGELLFDGQLVNGWKPAQRGVGMVFQSYALYPHMTVAQNVGFGLKLAKTPKAERERLVSEALEVLQLEQFRDRRPSELSGGQRQRVAIGRAIVRQPNVFLFDEPLSNLDTALRVQMRMEIGRLHRRLKSTVIYVTHDQVEAMTLADRIVVLDSGSIRQIGEPLELYERPANKFVAGFIGTPKMGFLKARIVDAESGSALQIGLEAGFTVPIEARRLRAAGRSGPVTLGIRPEHCTLCDPEHAPLKGEILEVERLGNDCFAFLAIPGAEDSVAVRAAGDRAISPGEIVGVTLDATKIHLFDADGSVIGAP